MGFSASTYAMISAATAVIGAGVSAVSSMQQGKSAQNLANHNAQIARNDAIAARQKAQFDATAQKRKARLFAGTQRASMAGTGGDPRDMDDVLNMSAEQAELEYLAILYGGEMGYRAGQQKATLASFEGSVAKQRATGQAASSLLTGASSAAGMGAKYNFGSTTTSVPPLAGTMSSSLIKT
tara:strand:- start:1074 stop:1616 length:543 start_codon:yes stop_codon:yes gene_type:complete